MDIENLRLQLATDERFRDLLRDCYTHAAQSPHPSTHTAALLVRGEEVVMRGINELPPGVRIIPERFEGENKHLYPNHAERDVIYRAAREGIRTDTLTMVMPWLPCIPCANAIITSGIRTLIVHRQMIERTSDRWQEELKNAVQILQESGVSIIAYDGLVGVQAYMHKELWEA